MTKVFIGGSRNVKRLTEQVRQRLDQIIEKTLPVLVGDANGADKAVQRYLFDRRYDRVEVFCVAGICRNNVGGWKTRVISPPQHGSKRDHYTARDAEMTREGSIGFMLWDGESRGTLANLSRLIEQQKKVVVYLQPRKRFFTLRSENDLEEFLASHAWNVRKQSSLGFGDIPKEESVSKSFANEGNSNRETHVIRRPTRKSSSRRSREQDIPVRS